MDINRVQSTFFWAKQILLRVFEKYTSKLKYGWIYEPFVAPFYRL